MNIIIFPVILRDYTTMVAYMLGSWDMVVQDDEHCVLGEDAGFYKGERRNSLKL